MLRDAFGMFPGVQSEPNDEAKHFYGELTEASQPLYEGSMHSKLSVAVEDALDVAYQNDISSVEVMVDDELAGELQHSEGIYEEFDATVLQSDLNNYGEGTSRANEEESQTEEYETSDDELLEENEISDEEEFDSNYESNEED
ncbi:hypothetical protein H5410_046437 [Solanum commersonii]|uniref:Uncharacterized protein n=1 Tax=Solanum commersonii TaxID=4109 RepID=A0A9J5XC92_SOLCO|nr:hypothetical protein H5410_046437 [Solanum commersonii]